jgi:hypothetical protein
MHLLNIAILRWVVGAAFANMLTLANYLSPIPG